MESSSVERVLTSTTDNSSVPDGIDYLTAHVELGTKSFSVTFLMRRKTFFMQLFLCGGKHSKLEARVVWFLYNSF